MESQLESKSRLLKDAEGRLQQSLESSGRCLASDRVRHAEEAQDLRLRLAEAESETDRLRNILAVMPTQEEWQTLKLELDRTQAAHAKLQTENRRLQAECIDLARSPKSLHYASTASSRQPTLPEGWSLATSPDRSAVPSATAVTTLHEAGMLWIS